MFKTSNKFANFRRLYYDIWLTFFIVDVVKRKEVVTIEHQKDREVKTIEVHEEGEFLQMDDDQLLKNGGENSMKSRF